MYHISEKKVESEWLVQVAAPLQNYITSRFIYKVHLIPTE